MNHVYLEITARIRFNSPTDDLQRKGKPWKYKMYSTLKKDILYYMVFIFFGLYFMIPGTS